MNRILIDIDSKSTRMALTKDGELSEFLVETNRSKKLVGNIYKGKVINVLSGMQAAFVSIGQLKNSFLHVGETLLEAGDFNKSLVPDKLMLSSGEETMVQVIKDETGSKGARVTQNISLPGRLVVLLPTIDFIGVSHKIEDAELKEKLIKIVEGGREGKEGYILRTAASSAGKREILNEMAHLREKYQKVLESYKHAQVNDMVYSEGDIVVRTLRDLLSPEIDEIVVNNAEAKDEITAYIKENLADLHTKIKLFDIVRDMYSHYGISAKIDEMLSRRVDLRSGAYLIFDRSEALNVIDVNTGKYTGDINLEDTVFRTNIEACAEIARQIRLRNLVGIIVIDFIDMELEEHKTAVVERLREYCKSDRIKCTVIGMTGLGLVEISRKKIRKEVREILQETCPQCQGDGRVLSVACVAQKLRAALLDMFENIDPPAAIVTVSSAVVSRLFSEGHFTLECEGIWRRKRIYVVGDDSFNTHEFRISAESKQVLDLPANAQLLY